MGIYEDITQAESSGNAEKPNPNSSAVGLGQFVNRTWLDMIRRYAPDQAQGKSDAEILELRKDPNLSKEMTRRYAEENEAKLRQAGIPVTPGSTYLMHFAGPSGGIALMKADPNTPVESILSDQAIKANPYLQGKTASWVIAWANKKMADAAKSSAAPQPAPQHGQSIPYLSQTQALDPAFGATSWPARPASPNTLPPDAARPFVDGTRKAQQALDNSFLAPGIPPWARSDRFGDWSSVRGVSGPAGYGAGNGLGQTRSGNDPGADGARMAPAGVDPSVQSQPTPPPAASLRVAPGAAIPGAQGRTSIGGPNGPAPLMPPRPSSSQAPADQARRLTSIYPEVGPLGRNSPGWRSGSDASSEPAGSPPNTPSFLPAWSLPEMLLAPDRNRVSSDLLLPLPFNQPTSPAQDAPGGIPGLLMKMGAFDPSHPDDPPAGGLLRLLQDYMRNNPDGGSAL